MKSWSRLSRCSASQHSSFRRASLAQIRHLQTSASSIDVPEASLPRFPGAIDSPFSSSMEWGVPSSLPRIPTYRILNSQNKIEDKSQITSEIPPEQVLRWYKNMLTVNTMDSIMFEAQRHGRVSFYMVSAGEEALMTGSAAALGPDDIITTQYREHGVFLERGFELSDFMNQLAANHLDPGKGRNMPVHYSGKAKVGIHAVASNLGTQIPHAVGAGYALKLQDQEDQRSDPRVAVAYFGEGAASEGDFHGALNMASVIQSPVIFICRNNGYAISTPSTQQYKGDGIASRGAGYGIESLRVDGTDIFAVYEATKLARKKALENGGRPILLEMMSYRISHHSTSDDSSAYRNKDEVSYWRGQQRNPIDRLRQWLEHENLWDAKQDKEQRAKIRKEVIKALAMAERERKPALSAIFDDVYADLTEECQDQKNKLREIMVKYPEEYDFDEHKGGLGGL